MPLPRASAYRAGLHASGPRRFRSAIRAPGARFFQYSIPWPRFFRNDTVQVRLDGMRIPDSGGFVPARPRIAALAGLAQCDGNGLLDRLLLCRRMAGAYRSVLVPVIHQCLDIAAHRRLAGSFSERHDLRPFHRINCLGPLPVAVLRPG